MARSVGKYFDKIVDMFRQIGDALPRLRVYEKLFPNHERLLAILADVYLDIIIFCVDAKALFGKAKRSSVTWTFTWRGLSNGLEKNVEDLLARFLRHRKLAEKEAAVSNMIEAKDARELARANLLAQNFSRKQAKRRKLLSALSTVNFAAQHRRRLSERHPGTCRWLLDNTDFKSWLNIETSSCFACYGIPGSGKTVLSASVIEELTPKLSSDKWASCYYYCDYSEVTTLNTTTIIGTLARQLLERGEIPEDMEELIESSFDETSSSSPLQIFLNILEKCLRMYSCCLLIVDGIDELPTESQITLLAAIGAMMKLDRINIKVLVSARSEENDIRCALEGPNFYRVELAPELISADLRIFIEDEVNSRIAGGRLVIGNPDIKEEIVDALSYGAKDM
jgi:hypothetical protein